MQSIYSNETRLPIQGNKRVVLGIVEIPTCTWRCLCLVPGVSCRGNKRQENGGVVVLLHLWRNQTSEKKMPWKYEAFYDLIQEQDGFFHRPQFLYLQERRDPCPLHALAFSLWEETWISWPPMQNKCDRERHRCGRKAIQREIGTDTYKVLNYNITLLFI